MLVGAMFFRWLQDEEFWCNNRFVYRIYHWITPFYWRQCLQQQLKLTKYYIDDNKLYYVGEDGTMGRIDIDNGNIKTGNKTYIEKRYYKVNKRMNFVVFCANGTEETLYLKGAD